MILAIFDLRYCTLIFTMFSILTLYNSGDHIESRPRLFQLSNLLISNNFKSYASLTFEQAQENQRLKQQINYDE